ncbi:MAG: FHA domain-containing protein [Planctomycetota bacterium]|nr:FHA domain-containing protein [Planctomycetota bacterium]
MSFQFALRFESGERRGEVVPVAIADAQGGVFTIGRRPGNSLQVTDPSVSGSHAELELGAGALRIRDLDSTNGTEVGGRRVRQAELGHGQQFVLGKVEFSVIDRAAGAPDDAGGPALELEMPLEDDPAGLGRTQIQAREEGFEITADDLARSRRTSKLGPILLVGLAALAGGAWYWTTTRTGADQESGRRASAARQVNAPPGHMLGGYSFEDAAGWLFDDGDGSSFVRTGGAAVSGRRGARVELAGGEEGLLVSEAVRVSGPVEVSAMVRTEAELEARIGVRFTGGEGVPEVTLWSGAAPAGDDFTELTLAVTAPPGYGRAAVLLRGLSAAPEPADDDEDPPFATMDVDDVAMVPGGDGAPLHSVASWRVVSAARAAGGHGALALASLDRTLVPRLRIAERSGEGSVAMSVSADGDDLVLRPAADGFLEALVHRDLAGDGLASIAGGDETGYAGHGQSFDAASAASLLLGADASLVRVGFTGPRAASARPVGDDVLLRAAVSAGEEVRLQLDFSEERTLAQRLARRADEERREGRSGDSLRTWGELLAEVPFDSALVQRAAAGQSEIVAEGMVELKELAAEVERASFFGLEELYREKLARAEELRARFRGSDVVTSSAALAGEIAAALEARGGSDAAAEAARLEGIAEALREAGSVGLAGRVDTYRQRDQGGAPR